jgi:hypothetical protein
MVDIYLEHGKRHFGWEKHGFLLTLLQFQVSTLLQHIITGEPLGKAPAHGDTVVIQMPGRPRQGSLPLLRQLLNWDIDTMGTRSRSTSIIVEDV